VNIINYLKKIEFLLPDVYFVESLLTSGDLKRHG